MGIDFVRRAARQFRKGLDRRRIELGTPTLFTQQPDCAPRAFAATVRNGTMLNAGEMLGIRLEGDAVIALRGLDPVAVFNSPPADLKEALIKSHGEACGSVQQFHDIAKTAEITVC